MKKKSLVLGISLALVVLIAIAGIYKFDYLASQPNYDADGNKISTLNPQEAAKAAYKQQESDHYIVFTSFIYQAEDQDLNENDQKNELFIQNKITGKTHQITNDERHVSAFVILPEQKKIIFAQAQDINRLYGKIPVINTPGRFSKFHFFEVNLEAPFTIKKLGFPAQSEVIELGFTNVLIWGSLYGSIYKGDVRTGKVEEIIPEGNFHFPGDSDMYFVQKIDGGNGDVYFQTVDSMNEDGSFVYGDYKMNLETKQSEKVVGNADTFESLTTHVIYESENGLKLDALFDHQKDMVVLTFLETEETRLKMYDVFRVQSASGAKYESRGTEKIVFWTKGKEASVFDAHDQMFFTGTEVLGDETQSMTGETIYFDPDDKTWNDDIGECHTCTPENGFGANGQIDGQPLVVWTKIKLGLKNDLDENPPVDEVRALFAREYSLDPQWFGTHVELKDNRFTIIFAASKSLEYAFRESNSALNAYYIVTEMGK